MRISKQNIALIFCFLFFILKTEGQSIRLQKEIETGSAASSLDNSNTEEVNRSSSAAAPIRYRFSTVKELLESSATGLTVSGSAFPTFKEVAKIAANNKSNYLHSETNTVFPHKIDEFERVQLISYVKQPARIDAIYKSDKDKTSITISIFPTKNATEGRLRNEYLSGIKELSKEKGKNYFPKPTFLKFNGSKYICNGVQGIYINDETSLSQFTAFECGAWLLGIKLDSEEFSVSKFGEFNDKLIRYFNPSRLTALKPMNPKPNVDFESEALKDTVVTGALFASALKKSDWANENVSARERASGFPDIYLDMHVEALKEYLTIIGKKKSRSKNSENARFNVDIKSIYDAGYLAEFILDTYENVILVPPYMSINMSGYNSWKRKRELQVDLRKKRYTINYRPLPY